MKLEKQILEHVNAMEGEMIELACDLVKINTVNPYSGDEPAGSEAEGQDRLRKALLPYDPEIDMFDPPADIYERMGIIGPKGRNFTGRPNLVATWQFDEDGPVLILNDHMDTVGVSTMTIPPFSGEIRDGKIWGRGTTDSKCALVSAVWAAVALARCGKQLRGKLILESAVDEECNGSGAGTLACCEKGYRGDAAIVVDGAGLSIIHGVGGVVTADVKVFGQEGHAAERGGVNAIDKALLPLSTEWRGGWGVRLFCVVKEGIDAFNASRIERVPDYPVNLGVFHAGSVPAVVPGEANLSINICYAYQEAVRSCQEGNRQEGQQIYDDFTATVRHREASDPWLTEHPSRITWVKDLIPFSLPDDHPLVEQLASCHTELCGTPPRRETLVAWTDASYLWNRAETPVALYSPGTRNVAHSAVEHIAIEDMWTAARVLALFGTRLLASR